MNQITHWLDASNIYGSDARETSQLRQGRLGRLKASIEPGKHRHPQDLPKCNVFGKDKPNMCTGCPSCYVAGKVTLRIYHCFHVNFVLKYAMY